AETSLVANADGYSQPAGLLSNTGTSTNTFPFKLLVDEALDPRTGTASGTPISNGGQAVGNYDVAIGGWQQANIGPSHDGWTGYGVLHQGQTASNTLRLNLAALSAGPVTLRTAIIANYNDPRGGANGREKRANRLPKSPADVFAFTYRMPHGATDVEAVEFLGESGGFVTNQVSASTLRFRVRDWDARAVETTEADLALDPIVTNVAPGESGPPALQVSIPDVLGPGAVELFDNATDLKDDDSAFGGDPEQD
ncbi:MAG TPA: hypothetical protein VEI97_04185, partial [bacterium]|nr:hypothetical protein [bacterium]